MRLDSHPTKRPRCCPIRVRLLVALALGTQAGCTREFFREWANQDATEAVFEKSRDPRWRLDLFSIEPPALSRFADPYDPDVPPAPPDDYATQALSPTPQWPDNRLLVPLEGTGYLDMLDAWQHEEMNRPDSADANGGDQPGAGARPGTGARPAPASQPRSPAAPPEIEPAPPLPPSGQPSPFGPGGNSGPGPDLMPPSSEPGAPPANPPSSESAPSQARLRARDPQIRLAAFQETGIPQPTTTGSPAPGLEGPRRPEVQPPPIGMEPEPIRSDLAEPTNVRPDLTPEQYRESEEKGDQIAGMFIPDEINFNEAEAAGLPRNSRPYKLTMEQAFRLALINARVYQFQLENVYTTSLAVTLQRFSFQPQFYAGLSPVTGVAGGGLPAPNPINQFIYRTRETGTPVSALNLGTVAGVGKVFNSGGRILMGFANQVVFNFLGQNSRQPTVQSFLPLQFVQPFLRGGGRALTLEALTQAERNLVYGVRSFAKFRQEFVVTTLVGGNAVTNFGSPQTPGFSGGGNTDPNIGFLNVIQDIQVIENDRKNIAALERLYEIYTELIKGEASGLTQLQVDQVDQSYQQALQSLVTDRTQYRSQLDQFKFQLGMPPDVPLILDRSLTRRFKEVFDGIDDWQRDPKRKLEDLPQYAANLPELQDVNIDGRSVLSVYNTGKGHEDDLEDLLLAAERVALEHRLDLMNERARLYDAWRQIRVSANALRGVFNVTLTNQFLTPPATTNPFAFVDQAKQFSLVLNAELPLVRLAERNQFRATLIGYQRQRRSLQAFEDNLKWQVRTDVRNLHQQYLFYEINRKNFTLAVRLKDQAFEQIIAPPQGAAGASGTAQAANAATQTTNLINFQRNLLTLENNLINTWLSYETARLSLYRDLGTLPFDEWEAYRELFPANYGSGGSGPSLAVPEPGAARAAEAAQP